MPTYIYRCAECKHEQEQMHSIAKDPEILCENCGKPMKRKFVPNVAIHIPEFFTVVAPKNPKWVDRKLDHFKEHPEDDPYLSQRDKLK
jgi:putative FmdB family regulatory protein